MTAKERLDASGLLDPIVPFFVVFYAVWAVRALTLVRLDVGLEPLWMRRVYLDGVRCLLWVVPTVLYVRHVKGPHAGSFLKLNTPPDRAGVIRGGCVAGLFLAGMMTFAVQVEDKRIIPAMELGARHWLGIVGAMAVGSFSEELLFRGLLLRDAATRLGFTRATC